VVARLAGVEGVTGGELRGGDGFGRDWGLGLWWLPIEAEVMGGSARSRGVGRWRWMGGGGPGCDERDWDVAAAELAGDEEDGFPLTITGCGGSMGVA
jgi:hypothetical protein